MASTSSDGGAGGSGAKGVVPDETLMSSANASSSHQESDDVGTKSRVEDIWKKMNSGLPKKMPTPTMTKLSTTAKEKKNKPTNNWMTVLGLSPSMASSSTANQSPQNGQQQAHPEMSEDAKKLAAAALAAAKNSAAVASGRGKVEITEVRDFAGKDIEIKKLVDANSKEAIEKAKAAGASAVDNILEQIRKKQKLSVLDKTKKDWGEYKEENRGLEEQLDAYKKSSNQYLDKQSFLQGADYREFERERDARLSMMAKRRTDMREDGA